MRSLYVIIALLFVSIQVQATAQFPNILHYQGKKYSLLTNPLDIFFNQHPDKKPQTDVMSSALWRGYIAHFKIEDEQLWVDQIFIQYYDEQKEEYLEKDVIEKVFPQKKERKADWYSGILVLPIGDMVNYIHQAYLSEYEEYLLIEIDKGLVLKTKKMNLDEYKQFKSKGNGHL